jgi:hypothetical protein
MIEIKCPRCEQYWYSDDEDVGRVRLCSSCAEKLRRNRGGPRDALDLPFLIAVTVLLVVDAVAILLTRLWPQTFSTPVLIYGAVLTVAGLAGLRLLAGRFNREVDWSIARWPLLFALTGIPCVIVALTYRTLSP